MIKIKVIVSIVVMVYLCIEIHKNVHVAMLIESRGKNRTKNIQFPYLVLSTQGKYLLNIVCYDAHVTKLILL